MRDDLHHSIIELCEAYYIIIVAIDLLHDLMPNVLIFVLEGRSDPAKDITQLLRADLPIAILVEHLEGHLKVILVEEFGTVHGSCDELSVVNLPVPIRIQLVDQLVPVLRGSFHYTKDRTHALLELINSEEAIVGIVKLEEHIFHVDQLRRLHFEGTQEGNHTGLEHILLPEGCHIVNDFVSDRSIDFDSINVLL